MYVKEGAVNKIRHKRQGQFYKQYIAALIEEACKLQMTKEDVINTAKRLKQQVTYFLYAKKD